MVWPKVYAETKDMWQEGNILLVEGRVRLNDDEVQLNCDSVSDYQSVVDRAELSVTTEIVRTSAVTEEPVAPIVSNRLVISLTQSSDQAGDITLLKQVVSLLQGFPGGDEVNLKVTNGAKATYLKLTNLTISYGAELHEKIAELVGEGGIRVDEVVEF